MVRELANAIVEKGYTYELVFESIIGIRNIGSATIDRGQLQECLNLMDFKIEETRFDTFFESFVDESSEYIGVQDILKEAKRLNAGVSTKEKKPQQAVQQSRKAQRRFFQVEKVKEFIG